MSALVQPSLQAPSYTPLARFAQQPGLRIVWLLALARLKNAGRQRLLGVWGCLAEPLALTLAWCALKQAALTPAGASPVVFFLSAALPWTWFTASTTHGMQALVRHANLIKSLPVNYALLPCAEFLAVSLRYLLAFALLATGYAWLGGMRPAGIMALVPVLAVQAVFSLGIALHLAVWQVRFRDTAAAWGVITRVWFLVSPLLYEWQTAPQAWQRWAGWNPLVPLLGGYREALAGVSTAGGWPLVWVAAWGLVLLVVGVWRLKRVQGRAALFV